MPSSNHRGIVRICLPIPRRGDTTRRATSRAQSAPTFRRWGRVGLRYRRVPRRARHSFRIARRTSLSRRPQNTDPPSSFRRIGPPFHAPDRSSSAIPLATRHSWNARHTAWPSLGPYRTSLAQTCGHRELHRSRLARPPALSAQQHSRTGETRCQGDSCRLDTGATFDSLSLRVAQTAQSFAYFALSLAAVRARPQWVTVTFGVRPKRVP